MLLSIHSQSTKHSWIVFWHWRWWVWFTFIPLAFAVYLLSQPFAAHVAFNRTIVACWPYAPATYMMIYRPAMWCATNFEVISSIHDREWDLISSLHHWLER